MPYADPDKQREYQRQWIAERRTNWLLGRSCVDCGSVSNLEIDHVDPSNKVSHRIFSWSAERREAELAKCVVRCRDCHLAKTTSNHESAYKLTNENVIEIKRLLDEGILTQEEIADKFGVKQPYISKIKLNKRWK